MALSIKGWATKAKEAPSPHEVRLIPLDNNPVFQCLGVVTRPLKVFVAAQRLPKAKITIFWYI